jgi:phosphoribosylformimino-5-aminoimidazole carboxamide ribotide isomerase, eukaryotic type
MKFRPCIDIHNGKVKQIVGSSVSGDGAVENYVSDKPASFYAEMYKRDDLSGGHIILLNPPASEFGGKNIDSARGALRAFSGGMQIGGGVTDENAADWIARGASHVIVTSFVFHDGILDMERLERLRSKVGRDRVVLDLSCKRYGGEYYIMTNRWQHKTDCAVNESLLSMMAEYCGEYLVHAVDVEGKNSGIDRDLCAILGRWNGIPVTYAGGISNFGDIDLIKEYGSGELDFTIGSSLDIFGGTMPYRDVVAYVRG